MSGRLTTVVFDFDGVIANTEALHLRAYQEVFGARGWTLRDSVYYERYLGYDDSGMVRAFGVDEGLVFDEALVRALVVEKGDVFARHLEQGDTLFGDASACIRRLSGHYTLGIASGALKAEIVHILTAAGLRQFFPVIVASEDVTACKPDPEPYRTAAARLGVSAGECLAIEDSPPGLQAARSAGMRTIGVTTTMKRDQLVADRVVDRLDEVTLDLLAEMA